MKLLEDAMVKITSVVSDGITAKSAVAMVQALVAGERDPRAIADLAKEPLRGKRDALAEALDGMSGSHHGVIAQALLDQVAFLDQRIIQMEAGAIAALAQVEESWGAYSNHTLWILLFWSIPIPAIMVPWLIWMRRRFYNHRAYIFRLPRPRRASHQSRHQQRQAALQPLPRLSRQLQEVERRGPDLYSGSGSRLSPAWARNPLMSAGRYWMRLSRVRITAAS